MTSPQPTKAPPLLPIKGSWEELLLQAQQFAAQQNDDAIPIFRKLVDRLGRLPAAQRSAADGRLQKIFLRAAFDLQYYLCGREQYDLALAQHPATQTLLPQELIPEWEQMAAAIRLQAGQTEEALILMRRQAEQAEIDEWGDLLFASLTHQRVDMAEQAVAGAEAWVNRTYQLQPDDEALQHDRAFVAYLKARLALAQGNLPQSLAWFEHAMVLDKFYRDNPQYLYTLLVDAGAYAEALTLIRRDAKHLVQAGFWHGILYWRTGQRAEAERQWRKVLQIEKDATGDAQQDLDLLELTLTHYYLGDKEGSGLGRVLNATREQGAFWGWFFLAGLGWAQRGDMVAARADFHLALLRRRSRLEGRKLARNWWQFCADLLDEPKQAQVKEYFEDATL